MLNDNGKLIMVEPNKNFIFDFIRIIWYKIENYFKSFLTGYSFSTKI